MQKPDDFPNSKEVYQYLTDHINEGMADKVQIPALKRVTRKLSSIRSSKWLKDLKEEIERTQQATIPLNPTSPNQATPVEASANLALMEEEETSEIKMISRQEVVPFNPSSTLQATPVEASGSSVLMEDETSDNQTTPKKKNDDSNAELRKMVKKTVKEALFLNPEKDIQKLENEILQKLPQLQTYIKTKIPNRTLHSWVKQARDSFTALKQRNYEIEKGIQPTQLIYKCVREKMIQPSHVFPSTQEVHQFLVNNINEINKERTHLIKIPTMEQVGKKLGFVRSSKWLKELEKEISLTQQGTVPTNLSPAIPMPSIEKFLDAEVLYPLSSPQSWTTLGRGSLEDYAASSHSTAHFFPFAMHSFNSHHDLSSEKVILPPLQVRDSISFNPENSNSMIDTDKGNELSATCPPAKKKSSLILKSHTLKGPCAENNSGIQF